VNGSELCTEIWTVALLLPRGRKVKKPTRRFRKSFIGDLDTQTRQAAAAATRLRKLGAPVVEIDGAAVDAVKQGLPS
jgi:hypothetical protein